eukprot:TRINITY_DN102183_c0_g1_i1.p1 TRINITY_DN102183_c0_g1~~TRINITY_DN102183_c0_g1_i1.p1  ORF type:complete len:278 (-),score=31.37 TRINITY_DN102183_c0_g1_i1:20-853(-)
MLATLGLVQSDRRKKEAAVEQRRCHVVVASLQRVHIAAAERVFRQCNVQGVRAASGVGEQPLGHEETLQGAANRLDAAKLMRPGADYYVAIESGISEVWVPRSASSLIPSVDPRSSPSCEGSPSQAGDLRYFDTGWVMVERGTPSKLQPASNGLRAVAPSAGVEVPAADFQAAQSQGREMSSQVDKLVAKRAGLLDSANERATDGVHSWLTAGRRSREAMLGEAIAVALGQLERSWRQASVGDQTADFTEAALSTQQNSFVSSGSNPGTRRTPSTLV